MSSSISSIMSGSYYGVSSDFFSKSTPSSSSTSNLSYLSDYSSIKNGSYFKLMRSYYGGNSSAGALVGQSTSTTKAADKINAISTRDSAAALSDSATKLLENGTDSLFNKKTVKGADGKETQEYDISNIYKSVASFVDDYNSLIDGAGDSSNNSILISTASIVGNTKANANLLSSIGITINSDNTLSIDEDEFKIAEQSTVKSLFNGTGSYAYGIASKSSQIYNQSVSQLAQLSAGTSYSSSGNYNYNYTGSLYSSLL